MNGPIVNDGKSMLDIHSVSRIYKTEEFDTVALNSVNIEIGRGEFVAVMGPSGCGKSTLLNIIGLLDTPDSGEYRFMGQDVIALGENKRARLRKHNIGFIFQNFNLIDELSVEENIQLSLLYHKISEKERKRRVSEVMDKVGIGHRAKHMPGQLSGGQQQRVAVARAVVANPGLILADEPTGNLDSVHGREVMEMLQALNDEGTTVIIVTHSGADADYARRTINLFDGQVVTESLRSVCR